MLRREPRRRKWRRSFFANRYEWEMLLLGVRNVHIVHSQMIDYIVHAKCETNHLADHTLFSRMTQNIPDAARNNRS